MAGAASDARDGAKFRKYDAYAKQHRLRLYTASQETTGRISKGFYKILGLCADLHDRDAFEATAAQRTWACRTYTQFWIQQIAMAFFSGCADMQRTRERVNSINLNGLVGRDVFPSFLAASSA